MRHAWLIGLLLIGGCQSGHLPDPNDPRDDRVSPTVLRSNLRSISDALMERRLKGEFDNDQYREKVAQAAQELVKELNLGRVEPSDAWEYAEVLRAGKNWKAAKEMLVTAVKYAKAVHNQDRFVNDSLRLAHVQANLGEVPEAIETAKTVMDAAPRDSAPILLAVLYEIVPASRGKGHDPELVELVEMAVQKHIRTVVDPQTVAGRDFLAARSHHLKQAYLVIASMLGEQGSDELAGEALRKSRWAATDVEGFIAADLAQTPSAAPEAPPREGQSRL